MTVLSPQHFRSMSAAFLLTLGLASLSLSPAAEEANLSKQAETYRNPVIGHDAPDPGILRVDNQWWMATTGGSGQTGAFPLYCSDDLVHWKREAALFAPGKGPSWAQKDFWAPEVHPVAGRYIVYFTARHTDGKLRVGAAVSNNVDGPFTDIGQPLVSHPDMGVIDATFFKDSDGQQYLYWKEDGNDVGRPSRLMAASLSEDGLTVVGSATEVLRNDPRTWEGTVVEGPEILKRDGVYYLFYAANRYDTADYAEGVARSNSPLGPFEKHPAPFLRSNDQWKGPGHAALTTDADGRDWLVYHSWLTGHIDDPVKGRLVLIDPIEWSSEGWPQVDGPSTADRAKPSAR